MKIVFKENHTGNEIVKALSSIPEYKTKVLTQTETFDEKLGIIPGRVKIQMISLSQTVRIWKNIEYPILIIIDNIVLTCRYCIIDMQINYFCDNGSTFNIKILTDNNGNKNNLTKKIENVIRQFLKNLYRKPTIL